MSTIRFIRAARTCFLSVSALGLFGCVGIDQDVSSRFGRFSEELNDGQNGTTFLNILRARDNDPITFTTIEKVEGQLAGQVSAGLPQFVVGPDRAPNQRQFTFGSTSLGANRSANNAIGIKPLAGKEFNEKLMTPIGLDIVYLFVQQDYPREILFWLFAKSVLVETRGRAFEYSNNAGDYRRCDPFDGEPSCFKEYVDYALQAGLTVQTVLRTGTDSAASAATDPAVRFCFDERAAEGARIEAQRDRAEVYSIRKFSPACQTGEVGTQGGAQFVATSGDTTLTITTRSPFLVYKFLGSLLSSGLSNHILVDEGNPRDLRLLAVESGSELRCFSRVEFKGGNYCVPEEADNTKHVFSILNYLTYLRTSTAEALASSAVILSP